MSPRSSSPSLRLPIRRVGSHDDERWRLRIRLSVMMFLQYFVWGIWLPMLGQHLGKNDLNLDRRSASAGSSRVYGFGAIIGPFILGQLADRYFATEKVMAVAHFLGGLLLIGVGLCHERSGRSSACCSSTATSTCPRWACPTRSPSAASARTNQNDFPGIRLWGTIGWIVAGLSFVGLSRLQDLGFYQSLFDLLGPGGVRSLPGWRRTSSRPERSFGSAGSASRRSATACGSPASSRSSTRSTA